MPKRQTAKPLRKECVPGADRLQKYVGKRKVSFYYQYPDGRSETVASAPLGDRKAIAEAEVKAKRKALDIQQGRIIAGSVAEAIDRFKTEEDTTHFLDQSKDGKAVRDGTYRNLTKFFGAMQPSSLKMIHGYQFLDDRAKAGAPIKANKEMALMSTMCNRWVRWGLIEANPFIGLQMNKSDSEVRAVSRHQVVRFYLWSRKQSSQVFRTMGCAALFTYLTGFRAAEVRPFLISGILDDGVRVVNAKRKKGEAVVEKHRDWSRKLRMVVERAKRVTQDPAGEKKPQTVSRLYLFANLRGQPYSRSGWGSVWQDSMLAWLASFDQEAATALNAQKTWESARWHKKDAPPKPDYDLVGHSMYFALQDVRPTGITKKLEKRAADAYDFAAHANPSTTHRHYDRRKVKRAGATE
jgi:hypothetical protein